MCLPHVKHVKNNRYGEDITFYNHAKFEIDIFNIFGVTTGTKSCGWTDGRTDGRTITAPKPANSWNKHFFEKNMFFCQIFRKIQEL